MALSQVYRNAECHLITRDHCEADRVTVKIRNGDVAGLTACRVADTEAFTKLVEDLSKREFVRASVVMPI